MEELKNYKLALNKLIDKSQEAFEKQLTYISGGSIGVSLLVIEKFFTNLDTTKAQWVVVLSWALMVATLVLNLYSHRYAERSYSRTIDEIDSGKYSSHQADSRARNVGRLNLFSFASLISGITLFLVFLTLNIFSMKNEDKKHVPVTPPPAPEIQKHGYQGPKAPNSDAPKPPPPPPAPKK